MTDQSLDAMREEALETLTVDIKNLLTWAGVGAESDAGEDLLARLNSLLAALPREPRKNADGLCSDCPPVGYPTDKTRCAECPRRAAVPEDRDAGGAVDFLIKCAREVDAKFWHPSFDARTDPEFYWLHDSLAKYDASLSATSAPEARGGLIDVGLVELLERRIESCNFVEENENRMFPDASIDRAREDRAFYRRLLAALSPRPATEGEPEAGRWKRVALALVPQKPDTDAHDGPCCYQLTRLDSGKERWVGQGCHCQNYDDAQRAGDWANDMNRWLDAQDLLAREGLTAQPAKGEDR